MFFFPHGDFSVADPGATGVAKVAEYEWADRFVQVYHSLVHLELSYII